MNLLAYLGTVSAIGCTWDTLKEALIDVAYQEGESSNSNWPGVHIGGPDKECVGYFAKKITDCADGVSLGIDGHENILKLMVNILNESSVKLPVEGKRIDTPYYTMVKGLKPKWLENRRHQDYSTVEESCASNSFVRLSEPRKSNYTKYFKELREKAMKEFRMFQNRRKNQNQKTLSRVNNPKKQNQQRNRKQNGKSVKKIGCTKPKKVNSVESFAFETDCLEKGSRPDVFVDGINERKAVVTMQYRTNIIVAGQERNRYPGESLGQETMRKWYRNIMGRRNHCNITNIYIDNGDCKYNQKTPGCKKLSVCSTNHFAAKRTFHSTCGKGIKFSYRKHLDQQILGNGKPKLSFNVTYADCKSSLEEEAEEDPFTNASIMFNLSVVFLI